ncbi:uncharacterized protein LOC118146094 [Callithrix jacchus]|uniref:translation initiation factor IF-2-like n=1 Tax=Callithrix jacchus TaxID=9483 RepID=UPI0023DCF6EA|nr:translation initiation factor IF-2-like [Callithrix jacchus]
MDPSVYGLSRTGSEAPLADPSPAGKEVVGKSGGRAAAGPAPRPAAGGRRSRLGRGRPRSAGRAAREARRPGRRLGARGPAGRGGAPPPGPGYLAAATPPPAPAPPSRPAGARRRRRRRRRRLPAQPEATSRARPLSASLRAAARPAAAASALSPQSGHGLRGPARGSRLPEAGGEGQKGGAEAGEPRGPGPARYWGQPRALQTPNGGGRGTWSQINPAASGTTSRPDSAARRSVIGPEAAGCAANGRPPLSGRRGRVETGTRHPARGSDCESAVCSPPRLPTGLRVPDRGGVLIACVRGLTAAQRASSGGVWMRALPLLCDRCAKSTPRSHVS